MITRNQLKRRLLREQQRLYQAHKSAVDKRVLGLFDEVVFSATELDNLVDFDLARSELERRYIALSALLREE